MGKSVSTKRKILCVAALVGMAISLGGAAYAGLVILDVVQEHGLMPIVLSIISAAVMLSATYKSIKEFFLGNENEKKIKKDITKIQGDIATITNQICGINAKLDSMGGGGGSPPP